MTCEYFSMMGEKVSCKAYGIIPASREKIQECQSNCGACFQEANQVLRDRIKRRVNTSLHPIGLDSHFIRN